MCLKGVYSRFARSRADLDGSAGFSGSGLATEIWAWARRRAKRSAPHGLEPVEVQVAQALRLVGRHEDNPLVRRSLREHQRPESERLTARSRVEVVQGVLNPHLVSARRQVDGPERLVLSAVVELITGTPRRLSVDRYSDFSPERASQPDLVTAV